MQSRSFSLILFSVKNFLTIKRFYEWITFIFVHQSASATCPHPNEFFFKWIKFRNFWDAPKFVPNLLTFVKIVVSIMIPNVLRIDLSSWGFLNAMPLNYLYSTLKGTSGYKDNDKDYKYNILLKVKSSKIPNK